MTRRRTAEPPHVARDDGTGCCTTCRLPLWTSRGGRRVAAVNARHVDHPADIPPAPPGPQDLAAGDLEDHRD
jgi:hypothetical protein